jgi:hypothetical protein
LGKREATATSDGKQGDGGRRTRGGGIDDGLNRWPDPNVRGIIGGICVCVKFISGSEVRKKRRSGGVFIPPLVPVDTMSRD